MFVAHSARALSRWRSCRRLVVSSPRSYRRLRGGHDQSIVRPDPRDSAAGAAADHDLYELNAGRGTRRHFKVVVQDWWRSEDGQQSFYAPAGSIIRLSRRWVSPNPGEATVPGRSLTYA